MTRRIGAHALVGMVHLGPLPGAPNDDGESISGLVDRATNDARMLEEGGFDAILLQNANDHPPTRSISAASLATYACVARAVRAQTTLPLGISVLKSDAEASFAIARAAEANFVRLKGYVGVEIGAEGIIEGCAAAAIRLRRTLGLSQLEIWADAVQPTSRPVTPLTTPDLVGWAFEFGAADRVIITGDSLSQSQAILSEVRNRAAGPLVLGGGVGPNTIADALGEWDAVIVGRYLRGGNLLAPIDPARVSEFREAAQRG